MGITVTQTSGAGQTAPVGQGFPSGIQFYVENDGVPVADFELILQVQTAPSGATGYFIGTGDQTSTLMSGLDGFTNSVGMYAGTVEGSFNVDIQSFFPYSGPSQFSMTNGPPEGAAVPTSIAVNTGNNQTVAPNTALPVQLTGIVKDQYGAAVGAGINVTATAPSSGASGVFAGSGTNTRTVATDGSGIASFGTFTTNGTEGAFYITLTGSGLNPAQALITIATPTSEVCTPLSKMDSETQTATGWNDIALWFDGTGDNLSSCTDISVAGTSTPASSLIAFNFDAAQMALIDDGAQITSLHLEFWRYIDGSSRPTRFTAGMYLNDRGAITATPSAAVGVGATWTFWDNTWTTFTNTGNAGNALYGSQLKGGNLQARLNFNGSDAGSGWMSANRARVIVCYINPTSGAEEGVSLQLCEV